MKKNVLSVYYELNMIFSCLYIYMYIHRLLLMTFHAPLTSRLMRSLPINAAQLWCSTGTEGREDPRSDFIYELKNSARNSKSSNCPTDYQS
jgi:hypothetical protein